MRAQVVGRDKRLACRERESLCEVHAHKQRADQPRRVGHGDRVDVIKRTLSRFDRFIYHADDRLGVSA